MRQAGGDAPVLWDGSAALVQVRLGGGVPAGIRRRARRPGTSCAGSSWRIRLCGRTGGIPAAAHLGWDGAGAGTANPVTGKRSPGRGYAAATVVHCESVLRGFYDFHLEAGTGPDDQSVPARPGTGGRAAAHHNPLQPFTGERAGRYRPKATRRVPRQIPDEKFDQLFAAAGLASGSGAGRVLGVNRGPGLGAAGRIGR